MSDDASPTSTHHQSLLERSSAVLAVCVLASALAHIAFLQLAFHRSDSDPDLLERQFGRRVDSEALSDVYFRFEETFYPEGRLPWQEYQPPPERLDGHLAPSPRHLSYVLLSKPGVSLLEELSFGTAGFGSLGAEQHPVERGKGRWLAEVTHVEVDGFLPEHKATAIAERTLDRLIECFEQRAQHAAGRQGTYTFTGRLFIDPNYGMKSASLTQTAFEQLDDTDRLDECLEQVLRAASTPRFSGSSQSVVDLSIEMSHTPDGSGAEP
ncbi:hypothetical protein FIV42_25255 [Persicimonas caeni]|uniref:Uncharacterized protein n=1 Tax=Persicimonas caeni TaxID=2292766 RepID=A0A4Y6Q0C2_PERCE|nr:hypothetical protein [Persicimonas caeni]QDG53930.1 hypothetical protein FIV42_25255 [Persicimonas caeni]QED35151.1 hypothetical protein FRD00_25250 [Persicimonas caeni]